MIIKKIWKNANEYTDNVIRYFRLTRFFYLRGNDYYIDLEPRRKIEIDSILETDNASAKRFASKAEYSTWLQAKKQNNACFLSHQKIQGLFDSIIHVTETLSSSDEWLSVIPALINKWGNSIAA